MEKTETELKQLKSLLENCKEQQSQCKQSFSTKMNWARECKNRLDALNEEMKRLYTSCSDDILQRLELEEQTLNQEIQNCKTELSELEAVTQMNSSKIYELNSTLRNIEANKNFRKTKAIIQEMDNKMSQLQVEIDELQVDNLVEESNQVESNIQKLREKSSSLSGKKEVSVGI